MVGWLVVGAGGQMENFLGTLAMTLQIHYDSFRTDDDFLLQVAATT